MKQLDYSLQKLVKLPRNLPNDLEWLFCDNNALTQLPPLPQSLLCLHCYNNKLIRLRNLPNSLEVLYCDNNRLTELGKLPKDLISLHCNNNLLTKLGELPNGLEILECENNPMEQLPQLPPSLGTVWISPWQIRSCLNQITNLETGIRIKN